MATLVTGGSGFIGSHTCVEMLNAGREIVVVDNYCNSNPEALVRVRELTGKDFKQYDVDVRDREGLRRIFTENNIDSVIHFAGLKAVGESVQMPIEYFDNNLISTLVLLEVMREFGCKRLVFSSSATVYGAGNQPPLTEEMPLGSPPNPYGRTKSMIEDILRDLCVADKEFSAVLLRYFNPIGAHPSGRIGENPNGIPNNIMPYITQVAVGRLPKLSIFGNDYDTPDGTCLRDYIHVVDLARGHLCAVDYAMNHVGAQAINLGTGEGYSVLDLVNTFMKVNNVDVPYVIAARRDGDLPAVYSSPVKAKELLNWETEYGLEEMCRDSWNWQKNNPNGYNC